MEANSKQEDYQAKLEKHMHNFHHASGQDSMLMLETTLGTKTLFLEDIMELITSLLMQNPMGILLTMIKGSFKGRTLRPSMIEEFRKINELPQAQESEYLECSKEKESKLEKNESVKGNDCCIKKTESEKEEVDEYHFIIANYSSCVLGVEDRGRSTEKELGTILEELPISLSLNLSITACNKKATEFLKYIYYKNHNNIDINNKKFERKGLVKI
ncbi:hypothetical protein M9H77_34752 [Catharanthus roseus]|uniref:Uncharacterized protein n=1 Tax=Catharanthus roseus TaxID=4058 RepID=A0ACB9ZP76_CATRO|nr:hypothetical protein M9H77_34752 [Catharanthus roseus]